jgi:serine/threonine protein kinase
MASITCATCGTINQAGASYCRSCGRALQIISSGVGFNTATGRLLPNSLLKQRYRILSSIGRGGMGAVYIAEDTQLGNRMVAVKEMSQSGLSPQEVVEAADNFKREALILAGLQHFHLPSIYDHFSESGRWYLVMSYIKGDQHRQQHPQPGISGNHNWWL